MTASLGDLAEIAVPQRISSARLGSSTGLGAPNSESLKTDKPSLRVKGSSMSKDDLVVVAGAGGFIGGHLVRVLQQRGHTNIRAVDIKPLDEWYQKTPGVENQVRQPRPARDAAPPPRVRA